MAGGKRKTWVQKRESGKSFHIEKLGKNFADMEAGATMLVPTPEIVDDYVRHIPKGNGANLAQMRSDLAATYGAQHTCPVTSGIFLRIIAEAAWEEVQAGSKESAVAPFWRIISLNSTTAKKLSFGTAWLSAMRQKENLPE